ncbi:MAG: alpha/beta hydrolase [Oscillospiraceae bacterium]|nr:alpha/beta hydrolase [Oscillospiraceae bacterium]
MDELKLVPVFTGPLEDFPPSPELPEGTIPVKWTDEPGMMLDILTDVVYDERDGEKLHLQILLPLEMMPMMGPPTKKFPLVVYVPGSAWMRQAPKLFLPRMIKLGQRGYAVAIVQYRPSEVAGFPAQIEDAKTAIRFMRKNAEEYRILTDRVALYGDSSGGHTAVMAGITGAGILDNGQYGEYPCDVDCIVDCFGPTNVFYMNNYPSAMEHGGADTPEGMVLGGINVRENPEIAEKASPMHYLSREKEIPPMLMLHGDRDQLVPFNQSVRLYDKLKELDKEVTFYKLEGAYHGTGGFNSPEALDLISGFIAKHIG